MEGEYWRRIHRGAVWLGRCPRCGKDPEECGHPRVEARVRKPAGLRPLEVTRAYENAAAMEEKFSGVIERMLERLDICGDCGHHRERHRDGDGACGRCVLDRASGEGCMGYRWSVTLGEVLSLIHI